LLPFLHVELGLFTDKTSVIIIIIIIIMKFISDKMSIETIIIKKEKTHSRMACYNVQIKRSTPTGNGGSS